MSPLKEPHYYNTDHTHRVITNHKEYLALFKNATENQIIRGEASVWYLYSRDAVNNILKDTIGKEVKFIVMIRNPIDMAYSLHQQQVFNLNEPILDFEEAWSMQQQRRAGKKISLSTRDSRLLIYGDVCKLGAQLLQLYEKVPRDKVSVVVFDDLIKNPDKVYKNLLRFLEVPYFDFGEFYTVNKSKKRKYKYLALLIKMMGILKSKLNLSFGFGILNAINSSNSEEFIRKPLTLKMRNTLSEYFKEDIRLLSEILNRDLKHWYEEI